MVNTLLKVNNNTVNDCHSDFSPDLQFCQTMGPSQSANSEAASTFLRVRKKYKMLTIVKKLKIKNNSKIYYC